MSARILSMGYHHSAAIGYREPPDSCFLADLMYIGSSFRRVSAGERLCAGSAPSSAGIWKFKSWRWGNRRCYKVGMEPLGVTPHSSAAAQVCGP